MALNALKRLDEALASCERAIELKPSYADAHGNRGIVLKELGRFGEALASHDKALALKPDYSDSLWSQANILLLLGNFERGLGKYEYRESRRGALRHRRYVQPQLQDAGQLPGKTLLIHHELYLGDMIQFCRYAILAEQKGARVLLSAQDKLRDLLSTLSPSIEIIPE